MCIRHFMLLVIYYAVKYLPRPLFFFLEYKRPLQQVYAYQEI